MPAIISLQRANRGTHFRGYGMPGGVSPIEIDPFAKFVHAWISASACPPHASNDVPVLSYLFLDSETSLRHTDTAGTTSVIKPGGLQWNAAGCGVVHEVTPLETGRIVHALHMALSSPDGKIDGSQPKLMLEPLDVPVVHQDGAKVRVVLGNYLTTRSPLHLPVAISLLDISLTDGATAFPLWHA